MDRVVFALQEIPDVRQGFHIIRDVEPATIIHDKDFVIQWALGIGSSTTPHFDKRRAMPPAQFWATWWGTSFVCEKDLQGADANGRGVADEKIGSLSQPRLSGNMFRRTIFLTKPLQTLSRSRVLAFWKAPDSFDKNYCTAWHISSCFEPLNTATCTKI